MRSTSQYHDPATGIIEQLEERQCLAAEFAEVIDNPFLPMIPGSVYVYRGSEDKDRIRSVTTVTRQKREIQGVITTVVRDREFINGELAEDTLDFFAQDKAGNVWYFGEESRDIEDGKVVSTDGSWLAGVKGARAGIIMKAHPRAGDTYRQERAPGIAEDQAEVLGFGRKVKTGMGTFGDCLQTAETDPLETDNLEHKFYAPGIGFVKAQDIRGGNEVVRLVSFTLPPDAFVDTIDNLFFPMIPGTKYVYRGLDGKDRIEDVITVTNQTKEIQGVTTTVVRDRAFVDGELEEDTLDWFAQDLLGNVWYFGEDSKEIVDGKVVSTDGSWESGVKGAKAGIIMKAHPGVGDAYQQEDAPKVAQDRAMVLALNQKVTTPFGTFGGCLQTAETTPLEPDVLEHKFYAPGIGFVMSQGIRGGNEVLRLVEISID